MTGPTPESPSLRHAVAFSFGQKYLAFFVHVAMTVVLARLLTPEQTGIFSLAAAAVGIGNLLRDFGTADYVISQKDVTHAKLRAAFTVTVLLAWAIAALLWLLAGPLAGFYKEPTVADVLRLLCLNFVLLPFGTISFAMLSKELRFGRIFVAQTGSTLLGAGVTLWAAWRGHGAISLALGSVVSSVWTMTYLLAVQPRTVFMLPTLHGLSSVVRFGGTITLARLIEQAANRSSDFIVTALLGFHAAGLLSKANSLIGSFHEFFNSAAVRVATPAFAQTGAAGGDLQQRYVQATLLLATVLWLFFPFLGLYAHDIVLLLFGAAWLECVVVVQVSAIGAMCWAPFMLSSSLMTARGAVAEQMRIQLVSAPFTVAALVLGAQHSLFMLAVATNCALIVRFVMIDRALRHSCGVRTGSVLRALVPSAVLGAIAACTAFLVHWGATAAGWPPAAVIAAGGCATALAAGLVAWQQQHPLYLEIARVVGPRLAQRRQPG